MVLKDLSLYSGFRGLPSGYNIVFSRDAGEKKRQKTRLEPICLVGPNGSGKSNILEVLAEIFFYLESYHKADRFKRSDFQEYKTGFGFKIRYLLPKEILQEQLAEWPELRSVLTAAKNDPLITVEKRPGEYPRISVDVDGKKLALKNKDGNREKGILPKRIVGYSSGMNELLSNPFIQMDFKYLEELKQKKNNAAASEFDVNRLFFMDYDANKYITALAMLCEELATWH